MRGHAKALPQASGELLADGHCIVQHRSLGDLLRVVHEVRLGAGARRPVLGPIDGAAALGAFSERVQVQLLIFIRA